MVSDDDEELQKLKWEAPPFEAVNPRQANSFYGKLSRRLKEKPGEWVKLPEDRITTEASAKQTMHGIREGKMSGMPKGEFEVVRSGAELWVRYAVPQGEDGAWKPSRPRLVQRPGKAKKRGEDE